MPPSAGFDTELHLIKGFSLSLIPNVVENFKRIVLIRRQNKTILTKNAA